MADRVLLTFESDSEESSFGSVMVRNLDLDMLDRLRSESQGVDLLPSVFRVAVGKTGPVDPDALPDVFGRFQFLEDGVRFTPHFPFERGQMYRASFDPGILGRPDVSQMLTLDFSLPAGPSAAPTSVAHIYPSSDSLPENLLRFYVAFSNSMQHGRAEAEIAILGPDGKPAPDVLYRAPVELWDRGMQHLTILLDPGRLKRRVGPNRELGPPLKAGLEYALAIGSGMLDLSGRRLTEPAVKRFRVTEAVRQKIEVDDWHIIVPAIQSLEPLTLVFPRPLDWALLANAITVSSRVAGQLNGAIAVDQNETRWTFTPKLRWAPGSYEVRVESSLEDVSGNTIEAPFDRPVGFGNDSAQPFASRSITFDLA